jgi:hypothetical protein
MTTTIKLTPAAMQLVEKQKEIERKRKINYAMQIDGIKEDIRRRVWRNESMSDFIQYHDKL